MNEPIQSAAPQEDRTLALITHLSGIIAGFIVPLIIWLINKDKPEKAFLIDQSREALNFQLTLLIVYIILFVLTIITLGLASPLTLLVWVASIVFMILAAVKSNNGEMYRYPVTIRMIK